MELVVMYGCENWTSSKKAECWRTDAFDLWCWRRLLRVPWTARRSNLSILKEISSEYSLEGLMLKLKLQYFGHLKWTTEDEMAGWHHRLDGHEFEKTPEVGDGEVSLVCCNPWGCKELDMTEWLKWTELNWGHFRDGLCFLLGWSDLISFTN